MDPNILSSIIGGASGVIGALITATLTSRAVKKQTERADAINAAYLTTQIGQELRSYASTCLKVAWDRGYIEGQRAGKNGEEAEITQKSPSFKPLTFDVDWRSLPRRLMSDVLTFPEYAKSAAKDLDFHEAWDPPDHGPFFRDRQHVYVKLGLKALTLADQLQAHSKVEISEQSVELRTNLAERQAELEAERARIDALLAAAHIESLSDLTGQDAANPSAPA